MQIQVKEGETSLHKTIREVYKGLVATLVCLHFVNDASSPSLAQQQQHRVLGRDNSLKAMIKFFKRSDTAI